MFTPELLGEAKDLLETARRAGRRLVTAESCTGGLVIACLTEIAGSSDVVERGFVTYSNAAKTEILGVPVALIDRLGAVSDAVAVAMAEGALAASRGDLALSITGIAGPGGATDSKPVGLVHFACASRGGPTRHERQVFSGDRQAVRLAATRRALGLFREALGDTALA